jgi:hypothetical protein
MNTGHVKRRVLAGGGGERRVNMVDGFFILFHFILFFAVLGV